jgi:hypothetical protein
MARALLIIALVALMDGSAASSPVPVHFPEGTVHGFLELRTHDGTLLAHGDLTQLVKGDAVESRMVFHFSDTGTVFDESVRFTQDSVFAMKQYHLVQRGSIFPFALDATIAPDGKYVVKTTSKAKDAREKTYTGKFDLPADTYNGMVITVAKNVRAHELRTVHIVAFTPEPRLIGLEIAPSGQHGVKIGGHSEEATEMILKPKLGAALAFFAKLAGKAPPDSHAWIITEGAPAFVRFEGPMYYGPVWRLTLASPAWPGDSAQSK